MALALALPATPLDDRGNLFESFTVGPFRLLVLSAIAYQVYRWWRPLDGDSRRVYIHTGQDIGELFPIVAGLAAVYASLNFLPLQPMGFLQTFAEGGPIALYYEFSLHMMMEGPWALVPVAVYMVGLGAIVIRRGALVDRQAGTIQLRGFIPRTLRFSEIRGIGAIETRVKGQTKPGTFVLAVFLPDSPKPRPISVRMANGDWQELAMQLHQETGVPIAESAHGAYAISTRIKPFPK